MLPSWQGRNAKIVVYLSVKCPIDLHSLPGSTEGFCCVMMALFSITRRLLCTACTANTVQSTTLHCSDYDKLIVVRPIYWKILLRHDGPVLDYETTTVYRLHCKYCTKYDSKYNFALFRLQPIGCCNTNLLKDFAASWWHCSQLRDDYYIPPSLQILYKVRLKVPLYTVQITTYWLL